MDRHATDAGKRPAYDIYGEYCAKQKFEFNFGTGSFFGAEDAKPEDEEEPPPPSLPKKALHALSRRQTPR